MSYNTIKSNTITNCKKILQRPLLSEDEQLGFDE